MYMHICMFIYVFICLRAITIAHRVFGISSHAGFISSTVGVKGGAGSPTRPIENSSFLLGPCCEPTSFWPRFLGGSGTNYKSDIRTL